MHLKSSNYCGKLPRSLASTPAPPSAYNFHSVAIESKGRSLGNSLKALVGARGFEPRTSCAQGSCKKSILLVRLALFYVMLHGFGPNSAVVGPKLDPSFSLRLGRR